MQSGLFTAQEPLAPAGTWAAFVLSGKKLAWRLRCRTTLQQKLRTRGTSWGLGASGERLANPRTAHLCTWPVRCQVSRGSSSSRWALGFRQAGTFGAAFTLLHYGSPSPEPLCLGLSGHGQVLKPWGSTPQDLSAGSSQGWTEVCGHQSCWGPGTDIDRHSFKTASTSGGLFRS